MSQSKRIVGHGVAVLIALSVLPPASYGQRFYWAQRIGDQIIHADVSTNSTTTILEWPELDNPVGIALDALNGKIYWAQSIGDRIRRADLNGNNVQTLLQFPEVDGPVSIALDEANGKIYWAQSYGDRIRRADLSGANPETILQFPQVDQASAITLDATRGKIYWAQTFGDSDRIARADLNGANVESLVVWPLVSDPVALALDILNGKIYWAQSFGDRILRANLDGSNVETLLEWPQLDDPVGIALDVANGKLIWAQSFDAAIRRGNLDGTAAETLLNWPRVDEPVALVFDPSSPPGVPSLPLPDPSGINKTRSISFGVPAGVTAAVGETALRVKFMLLHHVVPSYTVGASIAFTLFEGQSMWVGPPATYVESDSSQTPFKASNLQCTPHYQDWTTVGLMHVIDEAIVPSSSYYVENLAAACLGQETTAPCLSGGAKVSAALTIVTGRWGDVVATFQDPSQAASQPDFDDIGALVNKFKSVLGAPIKARAKLAGVDARGLMDITPDVDFDDIPLCVDAFKGVPYPYKPGKCTGAPATACITDADCGANGPCILCP